MTDLTEAERTALTSWLLERYAEMEHEEAFIEVEAPDLLPAIRKLLKIKKRKARRHGR